MNHELKKNHQLVHIKSLELGFSPGGQEAVKVLCIDRLNVETGEKVAIFGPSGSGKTTLLYVVAGLLQPNIGLVRVCGQELSSLSESGRDRFRAGHIGFIYQNFNLMQGFSALENVLLGASFCGAKPDRSRARQLLCEVGLEHRLNHKPGQLSSGEQQRVAVARALVNQPQLILADEPTASLHPANKQDVLDLLLGACERHGCTLLLVTHEVEILKHFQRSEAFLELNSAAGEAA
jgi:ABC-type lipoprotein export system ATPase subunit